MKRKLFTILMITVTVFVVGFSTIFMIRDFTKVNNFSKVSDMWSLFAFSDSTDLLIFAEIDLDDFVTPPYPERDDTLVSINGLPASNTNYFDFFNKDTPKNEEFEIAFLHEDSLYTTTIVTRTIPEAFKIQVWLMSILRTLIIFSLIIVGLWGFVKQPNSSAVLTLSLFCYSLALQFTVSIASIADYYAAFQLPRHLLVMVLLISASPAPLWLKLQLLFPKRNTVYERNRILFNLLIFIPWLIIAVFILLRPMQNFVWGNYISTIMLILGYIILTRNYRKATTFLEKRQTKLVLLGSGPGFLVFLAFGWFVQLFPESFAGLPVVSRMLIANILFLIILSVPISIGYAFGKYRLLQVEGKIKRGTRFLIVNFLLLTLFAVLLWGIGKILLNNVGIHSQTPILIIGVVLAIFFMNLQKGVRQKIEKLFYPERVKLRLMMKDFLATSMANTESSTFWAELEEKLADGLSAEKIYHVLKAPGKDYFNVDHLNELTPFSVRDTFIKRLESKENPLLFDEMVASGKITLTVDQANWFIERKSAILLPLVTTSGLLGFLVISQKTNGEDFTSEELDLLDSFSTQTAIVAENLELLSEKVEKEKLQEQLKVARSIQQGLLPGKIPEVPGLEISALIRFCLDVAGDYYDIIPLGDGRVVLSIGDVSGKGVGAALLMANLQASLRTAQAMGASLADSATRINKLVYENTPPDMFITFFMICINPLENKMKYVNAGHNYPFLVKENGDTQNLDKGGLLFGVIENATYEEGFVILNKNDMVLMFTDGVSEAMDDSEKEFGESNIARIASENRNLPVDDLLKLIEQKACNFHGSSSYADDFTLLAIRITK